VDEQGYLVECNQAALDIFELKEEDIYGKQFTELFIPEDFHGRYLENLSRISNSGAHRILNTRIETVAQRENGIRFPIELAITHYTIEGQKFFTGFIRDISERVEAEVALKTALVGAEKANRSKSEFLATMSHELRTPLNAIIGFSEVIHGQFFGPVGSERYMEYANDIKNSGRHLLNLVNDILDLSAIEANELAVHKREMFIKDATTNCLVIVGELAQGKGVHYREEIPDNLCALYADARAVSQILINLLSNAVKFTPSGGKVCLKINVEDGNHIIEVVDTGQGLPENKIGNLVKPFVRGQDDVLTTQEGSGLGLAIVKSLVDLHKGELVIRSIKGQGTSVIVTLPNKEPDAEALEA